MRKSIPVILFLFLLSSSFAQTQYEIVPDKAGKKVLKGIITQELLTGDTSFKWYAENLSGYTPNADAVTAFKKNIDSIELITFLGTWCEDSHFIIPKFYTLLDVSGFSKNRVTLIGVDRTKKTLSHLAEALNVINVPTIIVMKNGKEMGRVVEYGKYGMFDKELAEIINAGQKL